MAWVLGAIQRDSTREECADLSRDENARHTYRSGEAREKSTM